jgi:hypothetical protein
MAKQTDRERLARAVRADRLRVYGTVEKARMAADISRGAWDHVEAGDPVREFTLAAVERALGWPQGRADTILNERSEQPDLRQKITESSLDPETKAAILNMLDQRERQELPGSEQGTA